MDRSASQAVRSDESKEIRIERFVFAAAILWMAGYWCWSHLTGHIVYFYDDPIRINYAQAVIHGIWPHEFGTGWQPLPTVWLALWMAVLPGEAVPASIANLAAMLAALALARSSALRLGGPFGASVVSICFVLCHVHLRLSVSSMSEPLLIACYLGASWCFLRGFEDNNFGAGHRTRLVFLFCGYASLVLAQLTRYEAWPVTILLGVALLLAAGREHIKATAMGFVLLTVYPGFSFAESWFRLGHPWKFLIDIQQLHAPYHGNQDSLKLLYNAVWLPFDAIQFFSLLLSLFGLKLSIRREPLKILCPAVLMLASWGFVLNTVARGLHPPQPMERFLAVPTAVGLPLAAIGASHLIKWFGTRGWRPVAAFAMAATAYFWLKTPAYNHARYIAHFDVVDAILRRVPGATPVLTSPAILPHVVQVICEGEVDGLNNTLWAYFPGIGIEQRWAPHQCGGDYIGRLAMGHDADFLVVDERLTRGSRDIRAERGAVGWQMVAEADDMLILMPRADGYDSPVPSAVTNNLTGWNQNPDARLKAAGGLPGGAGTTRATARASPSAAHK